jgi:hypothetical protein
VKNRSAGRPRRRPENTAHGPIALSKGETSWEQALTKHKNVVPFRRTSKLSPELREFLDVCIIPTLVKKFFAEHPPGSTLASRKTTKAGGR